MFGELGNSDIHDNEPNYGFDEFYNSGDNSYASDNDRLSASQDEDLWDVGSYDSAPAQDKSAENITHSNNVPQSNFENSKSAQSQSAINTQAAGQTDSVSVSKKKGSGLYILLLLLVFVFAAGMFFYKKNMSAGSDTQAEQSMGDYFYDKASAGADSASQPAASEPTATVDVNLSESLPAAPNETAAAEKSSADADNTLQAASGEKQEKKLTPLRQ